MSKTDTLHIVFPCSFSMRPPAVQQLQLLQSSAGTISADFSLALLCFFGLYIEEFKLKLSSVPHYHSLCLVMAANHVSNRTPVRTRWTAHPSHTLGTVMSTEAPHTASSEAPVKLSTAVRLYVSTH